MVGASILSRVLGMDISPADFAASPRILQWEVAVSTQYYVASIGTFAVIPLLRAYNGERGIRAKYLFYTFYPLHLAILAAIAYFVL